MQQSWSTLEKSLLVSFIVEHGLTIWPAVPLQVFNQEKWQCRSSQDLHTNVYSGFVLNHQELETTNLLTEKEEQAIVCPCNGMLCGHGRSRLRLCGPAWIDLRKICYVKEARHRVCTLYEFIYLDKAEVYTWIRSGLPGAKGWEGIDWRGAGRGFWADENLLYLDYDMATWLYICQTQPAHLRVGFTACKL